jgi:DUF4097 and DUF4098 domain-containing protein YvlB
MRRIASLFVACMFLGGLGLEADRFFRPVMVMAASQDSSRIEKEFKSSAGKTLEVNLKTGGSLDITGWDSDVVSVNGSVEGRDAPDSHVEFNETASGVRIVSNYTGDSNSYSSDVRLNIKVPKRFNLKLDTMGGGIRLNGIEGDMGGKTMGGELRLSNLKGKLHLTTMGGAISLTESEVDGRVETMGGRVLIQNVVGDIKGASMGGDVIYKNVTNRAGNSTGDEVRISSMGGEIKLESAPAGADVMTMGGDIEIASAEKFVKAKTMGGNIKIAAVDGWVHATTMGGNIGVTMAGDPSQGKRDVVLTSMSGDVVLTVPSGLSMDLDIELAYTKHRPRDYKIISDFDFQQRESSEWDDSKGTPRKYIYGTGSVAGGRNRITIKTINGDVYLKRS